MRWDQSEEWPYGLDQSNGSERVIAVFSGYTPQKSFMGPVGLNKKNRENLLLWARDIVRGPEDHVMLFPADGDASEELEEYREKQLANYPKFRGLE